MAQQHELVLNISPQELVVASYIGDRRESLLRVNLAEDWQTWLLEFLSDQKEEAPLRAPLQAMAASTHPLLNESIAQLFRQNDIELTFLTHNNSSIKCEEGVGANRIANAYGARTLFQGKNLIIIDIDTLITFDALSLEGVLLKGVTAPGLKEDDVLYPNNLKNWDLGIDMLIGGMERIVKKMRQELQIPLSVVATGGILGEVGEIARPSNQLLKEGLKEFVDTVNPELTLYGIHTALKEQSNEYTP